MCSEEERGVSFLEGADPGVDSLWRVSPQCLFCSGVVVGLEISLCCRDVFGVRRYLLLVSGVVLVLGAVQLFSSGAGGLVTAYQSLWLASVSSGVGEWDCLFLARWGDLGGSPCCGVGRGQGSGVVVWSDVILSALAGDIHRSLFLLAVGVPHRRTINR